MSELGIKFRTFFLDFKRSEQRSPFYLTLNPNSRVPAIIDHDYGDHVVWESGSIFIYLSQRPSPMQHTLYGDDFFEQSSINSWLFYQVSGHAPMIGQALHFRYFHPEIIPTAVERYTNEVRRIYAVIEMKLSEIREQMTLELDDATCEVGNQLNPSEALLEREVWLVGGKITIADLCFVTWNYVVDRIGIDLKAEFPEVFKWTEQMLARPQVRRALSGLESS